MNAAAIIPVPAPGCQPEAAFPVHIQRGAEHLHAYGPTVLAKFLKELADAHGIHADLVARLDDWRDAHLDAALRLIEAGSRKGGLP